MQLRECVWRKLLKIPAAPLPRISKTFHTSETWLQQAVTFDHDVNRMPVLHKQNVQKIVMRHAATMPNHGYCQGHLYILYVLGAVFRDEASIYWAYARMCQRVRCFGPDTYSSRRKLPSWVLQQAVDTTHLEVDTWDLLLRMRWLFIMFGQTFTSYRCLCAVWDYVIHKQQRLLCMCAALLQHAFDKPALLRHEPLEYAREVVAIKIDDIKTTATIIAQAQAIERKQFG